METANEREKLMFRVKARLDPALLEKYITYVKTGVPGMAYLRLDPEVEWPANLQIKVPQDRWRERRGEPPGRFAALRRDACG